MNRFLDKFCNQSVVDKRFLQTYNMAIIPGMPHYLTDKGSNVIKHRVYSGDSIVSTLDMNKLDIYILVSETTLCCPGILMVGELHRTNFRKWYDVEPLNTTSDFINLKDDDIVLVTRKDTGNMVARGRHVKCGVNEVELSWGNEHNLELLTFSKHIHNFHKLIRIK